MRRLKLIIEYKGTNFKGWQRQENGVGVQELVENALSYVLNERITVFASGRTDAGVHAFGQVVHFDTESTVEARRIPAAANSQLPFDIRVKECAEVPPEFNARAASAKTYVYKCYVSRTISPVRWETHDQIVPPIDLSKMREAAACFLGEHDFTAFMSKGSTPLATHVRTVYRFDIEEKDDGELWFTVRGNGFLYNMVRIMVMAVINCGKGRMPPEDIPAIIRAKDRTPVKELMPAKGLYLYNVEYSGG